MSAWSAYVDVGLGVVYVRTVIRTWRPRHFGSGSPLGAWWQTWRGGTRSCLNQGERLWTPVASRK